MADVKLAVKSRPSILRILALTNIVQNLNIRLNDVSNI